MSDAIASRSSVATKRTVHRDAEKSRESTREESSLTQSQSFAFRNARARTGFGEGVEAS